MNALEYSSGVRAARRTVLLGFGSALLGDACSRPPRREAVLEALVRHIVAPDALEMRVRSRAFAATIARLAAQPNSVALDAAKDDWKRCVLAWKRAGSFRRGPIMEKNALARATSFPARRDAIEAVLAEQRPLDAARLEELGANAKGLFALEYLFFEREAEPGHSLLQPENGRVRRYAELAAELVKVGAERVAEELGSDGGRFAAMFAQGATHSVNVVVGQMVENIERLVQKLATALRTESTRERESVIDGLASGLSLELSLTTLSASARFYNGNDSLGLGDLVAVTAAETHEHLRAGFSRAERVLRDLGLPIERAASRDKSKIEKAISALKELEVAMKTELSSALGVTLTFIPIDGD